MKQPTLLDWANQSGRKDFPNQISLPGVELCDPEQADNEDPTEVKTMVLEVKAKEVMMEEPVAGEQQQHAGEVEVGVQGEVAGSFHDSLDDQALGANGGAGEVHIEVEV